MSLVITLRASFVEVIYSKEWISASSSRLVKHRAISLWARLAEYLRWGIRSEGLGVSIYFEIPDVLPHRLLLWGIHLALSVKRRYPVIDVVFSHPSFGDGLSIIQRSLFLVESILVRIVCTAKCSFAEFWRVVGRLMQRFLETMGWLVG